MIEIRELSILDAPAFWEQHYAYLERDIFPYDEFGASIEEDRVYFCTEEYRGTFERFLQRETDPVHWIAFVVDGVSIGYAQYVIYVSEDGKCLLCDFWVLPEFRGSGTGHACFSALRQRMVKQGALYYSINISNHRNHAFWSSIGFRDDGFDEWQQPLMRLDP